MAKMTTEEFIHTHRNDDVRQLALQGAKHPDVDMALALQQIAGWQTARRKLPSWAEKDGIIYPPHISMEQCSSEQTALYKRSVVERLCPSDDGKNISMVDLTGGFGVDFSFLATHFRHAVYIEMQSHLCEAAQQNFKTLGLAHAEVVCGDGTEVISSMKPQDFAYLDPARRNLNGGRTYAIEDCSPNVKALNSLLLEKASVVMVKLSPMLDWRKAADEIRGVSEVHIVSSVNECKELLLVLQAEAPEKKHLKVFCINDSQNLSYTLGEESEAAGITARPLSAETSGFLYEPNASLMKAGCFSLLCQRYGAEKIAPNSNLFISADEIVDFPGRRFKIEAVSTMNKRDLKSALQGIGKANVAVRNFPLSAQELQKKLKLKDGGDVYLFGTTDSDGRHVLIRGSKA